MSPMLQVKVLRVLQERRFRRVGGTEEVEADIRIIAATNRDLAKMVAEGQFREDLFYRINVIPVRLPALRERGPEDVAMLAEHFVAKFAEQMGKTIAGISHPAMTHLASHAWPGNVRELENAMERAVALERTPSILPESLPDTVRGTAPATLSPVTAAAVAAAAAAGRHSGRDGGAARPRQGVRPRAARPGSGAGIHRRGAAPVRRRQGQGRGAAGHELPVLPLLHEEVQPEVIRAGIPLLSFPGQFRQPRTGPHIDLHTLAI
jgi:DNA-binding NtrC family response regulator